MSTPSSRLAQLGYQLPTVVTPLGSYRPALEHDGWIVTSGQLPMVNGLLLATGLVGETVDMTSAQTCARQCALNAVAAAAQVARGVDNLGAVIKVTGYVAAAPGFTQHPQVLNGASDFLAEIFGESGRHARSAVGVASLPLGAPVELEVAFAPPARKHV